MRMILVLVIVQPAFQQMLEKLTDVTPKACLDSITDHPSGLVWQCQPSVKLSAKEDTENRDRTQ